MEKSSEYLLEGAYKNREVVCASIFQSKMNVVFENESYSAPVGTNSWLMQLYGNYMEMPLLKDGFQRIIIKYCRNESERKRMVSILITCTGYIG